MMICRPLLNKLPSCDTVVKHDRKIKYFMGTVIILSIAMAALALFALFYKQPPQGFVGKYLYPEGFERTLLLIISGVNVSLCLCYFFLRKKEHIDIESRLNPKEYAAIERSNGTLYIGRHENGEIQEIFVATRAPYFLNRPNPPSLIDIIIDQLIYNGRSLQPFNGYRRVD